MKANKHICCIYEENMSEGGKKIIQESNCIWIQYSNSRISYACFVWQMIHSDICQIHKITEIKQNEERIGEIGDVWTETEMERDGDRESGRERAQNRERES